MSKKWLKIGQFQSKICLKLLDFGPIFGPGLVPLQTRVRVRELDPGTDALVSIGNLWVK